jgi:CheY-like chemotaxis protein
MSLVGNLEDLGLGEILQIVSLSRRSGVLSLASRGREARIIFQNGQVIRASSTTFQQNLGEVLIQKGVIDLTVLKRALSIQADEGYVQLLGAIMIERFGISAEAIETVVREQIENVVYSLFAWAEGTFEFELQDIAPGDAAKLDPVQFMLAQGLNPQYLAMEGSRIIDEKRHRGETDDDDLPPEPSLDFAFDLLQAEPPAAAAGAAAAPSPSALPPVAPELRHGRPLVLVDDDPATLQALAALLEEQGYRVDPIERAEDALIRVDCLFRDGIRPTVVVDLIMPRMDGTGILGGLELLELVRGNFPDLALLALSDFRNEDAQRKARGMGVPIVMKPLKGELAEGIPSFTPALLAALARVEEGGGGLALSRVNIGDELRLEMGEEPALPVSPLNQRIGVSQLRGMLDELNNPALGGEIILLVLRYAAEFMNRAVVLLVKKDAIQGLGQFGIADRDGSADVRIRSLKVPRGEPSLFAPVLESRYPQKGEVDDSHWSEFFLGQLGDARPTEVFVAPIVSEGKVVAVLYGDNLPEDKPIGDTDSLEIFLSQAGIAMEKALLQRRLQEQVRGGS